MIVCCSTFATAADIDRTLLKGKWLVIQADQKDMRNENEIWEFTRDELRLILDNDSQPPVLHEVSGDTIYIDSFRIKVYKLTESHMTAKDNGVLYELERYNK